MFDREGVAPDGGVSRDGVSEATGATGYGDTDKLLTVSVPHNETVGREFGRPGRREAAACHWFLSLFESIALLAPRRCRYYWGGRARLCGHSFRS
jgi:hypothetical protein